jgi:hypothetical protein
MNYAKPVITAVDAAMAAIEGVPKSVWPVEGPPTNAISVNAYEADE